MSSTHEPRIVTSSHWAGEAARGEWRWVVERWRTSGSGGLRAPCSGNALALYDRPSGRIRVLVAPANLGSLSHPRVQVGRAVEEEPPGNGSC